MEQEGWEQDGNSRKAAGDGSDTAKPRSDAEQKANDVALIKLVVETITPQIEAMGLGDNTPGLHRLENFRTEPIPSDVEGKIARGVDADGVSQYEVVLASHIVESGDQAVITRVVNHELGHAVDMSLDGGVYSAQPELQFVVHPTRGTAIGIGPVAREIMNHFKADDVLAKEFAYPLQDGLGYDAITLAKETFAQAWHAYLDVEKRARIELLLPKTAQYLSEVLKHAQDTTTEIHSPLETGAEQLRTSFGARGERTGDTSAAGSREGLRSTEQTNTGTGKTDGSNAPGTAKSLDATIAGRSELDSRPGSPTEVNPLATRDDGQDKRQPDALYSRHLAPSEKDQLALRPRSPQEQQHNDALLQTVLADVILPQLEQLGIDAKTPGMARVTEYKTEPMKTHEKGMVLLDEKADGMDTYRITIASHLLESGKTTEIVRAIRHEQGHAIDMTLSGGIYSRQPEMGFRRDAKSDRLHETGDVSGEILDHYRQGGNWRSSLTILCMILYISIRKQRLQKYLHKPGIYTTMNKQG